MAELPARELVPGDLVRLRLGNIVPGDAKLTSGEYLLTDESALTGESLPVEKHPSDQVYASSIVRQGEMKRSNNKDWHEYVLRQDHRTCRRG